MISDQDYRFISRFDSCPDSKARDAVIQSENPLQLAETFYTLLSQVNFHSLKSKNREWGVA